MKEIFFDPMTAQEVAARIKAIDSAAAEYQKNSEVLNAVLLTVARANGCAPTDEVRLNEARTGITVSSPPQPPHAGESVETPGEAVEAIPPAPLKGGQKAAK